MAVNWNTIKLKNYSDVNLEYVATAVAITPGMLLELTSSGTVQAHSTIGGNNLQMFACEDELQGRSIATNYAVSSRVFCWVPTRGDEVYAILANDQDVSIGDFLESAGNGFLRKHDPDVESSTHTIQTGQIVGIALEAMDLLESSLESSASPLGHNKRIRIRVT